MEEDEIVVRSCNSRLCVNPDHARVVDRRAHAAVRMRQVSALDWDAVHEIRQTLSSSREGMREQAAALATRFGVREHTILAVFRNVVWVDPEYVPGFEVPCAGPYCDVVFRSTSTVRKYHSEECCAAAMAARTAGKRRRGSHGAAFAQSPGRRAREEAALRAEAAAAEAEWSEVVTESPRTSVWTVASLDQPIGEEGTALGDVIARSQELGDPEVELEHALVREMLAGLSEEAVERMSDAELVALQERLSAADISPSISAPVST